ncbi:MAG: hypothetical protein K1X88_22200 [Nannocystaceae bacterium]|nr:hypothetical protein [Nannocystaceae bacterium]
MRRRSLVVAWLAWAACQRPTIDGVAFDQPEALPGFTVSLPAGKRVKSEITPAGGEIAITLDGAVVSVAWLAGRLPQQELPAIGAAMQSAMGGTVTAPPEQRTVELPAPDYGIELTVATDTGVLRTTAVQCDVANVTVVLSTMAGKEPARSRAFHDRLLATLRCGEQRDAVPVDGALPDFAFEPTLAYLPGSDPPAFLSLSGARWFVTPGPASSRAPFGNPAVIRAMIEALGMRVLEQTMLPETPGWQRAQLQVSVDGETGHMLMGQLTCGDVSYWVLYTAGAMALPAPDELARVRCPASKVDPTQLPTVSAVFGGACDRGDAEACARLSLLVDEEPTLLKGHDTAALRARACSGGLTEFCAAP